MRARFFNVAWLEAVGLLLLFSSAYADNQHASSTANEEGAIRMLISEWVKAYRNLDAKRLTALEMPDVEVEDRFGELTLTPGAGSLLERRDD